MTTIKRFLTLFLIATVSVAAWGAEASVTFSSLYSSNTVVDGTAITITSGITATFGKRSGGTDTQYYTNGSAVRWYGGGSLTISSTIGNITAITITYTRTDNTISADVGTWSSPNWTGNTATIVFSQAGTSGHLRISTIAVTYTPSGGGCTDPTTPLSITNANTATIGTPLSLTTAGGNGSDITWSIVSGGSYASLSGSTLTPSAVGTVRVQASQGVSGGKCGATITQDITISLAPIDVTLYYKGTSETKNNQPNPYTLPTTGTYAANACDAWTFDGWYGNTYTKSTTKPTYITQLTSTGSAHAVYKHTEGGGVSGTWVASEQGWENEANATTKTVGDITVSWAQNGGTNPPKYYTSGTAVRAYGKNRFTVSSTKGNISSIVIGFGSSDGSLSISTNTGTYSNGTWTGDASSVTFTVASGSGNRRIASITATGGTTYYSTDAECGPKVQATASPWVTSTNGQFVKVEVPVTATNFDKNSTLSASVSGAGFSIVGWGANGNVVTKDVDLTTSLILEYNPTAYNTTADATITFSSNYSGSQTPVYTAGTVHGRSLPEKFVIAIKNGDQWYAMPANMSGSGTYAGEAVSVDNINTPTKVTAGPATALYSLLNVYKTSGANDRYADYGTRVRFLGNEKCLWSNAANGGTGINNGAAPASATSDNYEWSLVTTDGITYAINTNVAQKIDEGRNLYYRDGESRFGMYTSGNNSFRFLPVDCDNRATVTATATTYNSVTLTWAGKSGTSYNVYIDEGGVTKKTETDVTSPITISGLSSETNYTWIISPGAKNDDCALSGNFTTNVAPIYVTLSCDGITYPLGAQDKPYTLPTSGVYVADACSEWQFVGWTNGTYNKSTSAPTMITEMNADGTAYAVYRHTEGGGSTAYTLTIRTSDFAADGYAATLNDIDAVADDDNTNTMSVSFDKSNAGKVGSVIQFKSNGYIYNTTELGTISSISTNNSNIGYYINSTENPSSAGSGGYFKVYGISSTATNNTTSSIDIHFSTSSSTSYYATSSECCNEVAVPTVVVEPVDVSATISWDNQSSAVNGYNVTCTNGTDQDVAAGVTSLVISGLSASTSYDYTVTAKGATCNRTFEGSFTTASCSDVPTDVIVTPGTHTATIRWTAVAATATIIIYDDEQGTSIVTSVANQTSPCTISGLNDNTNYYLQVLAGGTCPNPLKPFTTQSTAVSIAEWFPDGININLNADEASATVLIEDKQEKTASSTSYADGLFFSKYYEAYRNVKLWAVYNGTADKISLANVKVKSSNNGSDWGKTNYSDDNQKITSLASFGHVETGYIYPGEEIIVYSDGNDTQDEAIISCMESTYGDAYKNNPDSLWYLVENLTTSLSGDDGLILLDGTDTLDVIGGTNANAAYLAADSQPIWGDNVGWNCDDGEDAEGNTLALSTNRCLLVRKNTVKSGLNAVAQNKDDFNTLCDEWWGAQVPTTGDQVQSSCDNFSYVGHYDYNSYYAHYDSLTTVQELGGKLNEDGTYTIPIPQLDTLSCTMLRVKVYEGTEEKASAEYKVPIMVEGSKKTDNDIFKKHEVPTCKECDVIILKGATLEKTNGVNDRDEVRNLTIYPGGTLIVPSDKGDYTVQSVQFRVENETAPIAKLNGNLITKDEQVIVSRRIKNDRYYFFSLPYDCNIADIRLSNGEAPVRGVDYEIVEYDGERRAIEGSQQGAPGHWKVMSGSQIKAGVGYNIAVNSKYLKELVFPMAIGGTNLTDIENTKTSNTVEIHQYTGSTTINNHNWNLVAHPYVSAFSPYSGDKITAGILEYTEPANPGEQGTWDLNDQSNVYITLPSFNSGSITYTQTLSTTITSLNPFLAVFVQGAGEGNLTFEQSGRKLSAPARHLAAEAENEDLSIFAGVTLSGNGESDETSLRIRPDFTDEYQLGYDLEKFITFYTPRPQVYMKTPSNRLAFQAVSDEVAKSSFLPMGVYCEYAGTYTFELNRSYPTDEIEAVYLYDANTGTTANLLYDSYSFTSTGRVYTNTRFSLNVIVKRREPQTATGIDTTSAPDAVVRKILINGHVYIQRGGALYDITGKQLLNH